MPGAKLPVVEIEKLYLKKDGRGIYVDIDTSTHFSAQRWTGSGNILPAASTACWFKITDSEGNTYYLVGFNKYW